MIRDINSPSPLAREGRAQRAKGEGVANLAIDPELQPYLARDGIRCLTELITGQQPGAVISAEPLGSMLILIRQAGEAGHD